jgi:hypothetical protein
MRPTEVAVAETVLLISTRLSTLFEVFDTAESFAADVKHLNHQLRHIDGSRFRTW